MTEASFLAAFAGGVLSLLAPCSALLLPAFFANAFTSPTQLFGRTLLFLAGLSTVFIPLGLGASLVASLLIDYRETTILVAGLMLIGFGIFELLGGGFSFIPPGVSARFQGGRGTSAIYGTGLVYGISGFCAGPLLGAVLTVASTFGDPLLGGALLFTYALGTAAPLFFVAWLWDRYKLGHRAWLRGRPLQIGPWQVHSSRLISGLLFISLGISFIWFQGSSALGLLYADLGLDEQGYRAQAWVDANVSRVPNGLWLGGLALVIIGFVVFRWSRRRRANHANPVSEVTPNEIPAVLR